VFQEEILERKDGWMWKLLKTVKDDRTKVLAVLSRCEDVWSFDGLSSPTMIAATLDDPKGADHCCFDSDSAVVIDRERTLRE